MGYKSQQQVRSVYAVKNTRSKQTKSTRPQSQPIPTSRSRGTPRLCQLRPRPPRPPSPPPPAGLLAGCAWGFVACGSASEERSPLGCPDGGAKSVQDTARQGKTRQDMTREDAREETAKGNGKISAKYNGKQPNGARKRRHKKHRKTTANENGRKRVERKCQQNASCVLYLEYQARGMIYG